jgi:hypothetical protein
LIPHERSLVQKLADEPFALIGINSDTDREKLVASLATEQVTWRQICDGSTEGPIATAWNVSGWPTTYVIDARGLIRFKNLRGAEAEAAVMKLLAEAKHETPEPR